MCLILTNCFLYLLNFHILCEQKIFISYLFNSYVFVSKIKRDMENRQIFSETEKLFIVHKVAENKKILENKKKTDSSTIRKKCCFGKNSRIFL